MSPTARHGSRGPAELAVVRDPVGAAPESDAKDSAERQAAALARFRALRAFYGTHGCRMAALHVLGGGVAVLHRFPEVSATFARIGELLQPVHDDGRPRHARWEAYARACRLGRALEVRDELWIAAHVEDLRLVRRAGHEDAFLREAAEHPGSRVWELMARHFRFTLGARRLDEQAREGSVALETAMSDAMSLSVSRMLAEGFSSFVTTLALGVRALASGGPMGPGLPSYRRVALDVARFTILALATVGVWRKGQREVTRGEAGATHQWPILAQTLGDRVAEVHPLVVAFYGNPAHYDVRCQLELHTAPARFWSWLLTLVAGQGLYETGAHRARIRTYRRSDGSMHFVREVDTGQALRVFDSDFLVREHRGTPVLFERFSGEHLEYELIVTPLGPGLGVSIRGRDLYWRGLRLPSIGLEVEFRSAVEERDEGAELHLEGVLALRPRTAVGRFFARRVLRRPEVLGCIRYVAVPRPTTAEDRECPFLS